MIMQIFKNLFQCEIKANFHLTSNLGPVPIES